MSINLVHESARGYHDLNTTNSYVKGRPQVPIECIEFVKNNKLFNLSDKSKCVDLASGTGKFTELLAKSNFLDITAIEPSPQFRDACSELLKKVKDEQKPNLEYRVLDGVSTSIPLESESVDVLFISQAFHWFSNTESLKEIERVLKTGGVLIMIWYDMDLSSDVVKKYADVVHENYYDGIAPQFRSYKWKNALTDYKKLQDSSKPCINTDLNMEKFHFIQKANKQVCIERALSISYISSMPQDKKDQVVKDISQVLDAHPDSSDNKTFDFPYRVELYWTIKKQQQ